MVVTPDDWEMVGGDPAPGEPSAYVELSRVFGRTAEAAGDAQRRLKAIQDQVDDAIWRGKSADGFRGRIDKLPGQLEKLHASYDRAGDAMSAYATKLRDLRGQATTLVGEAVRAHGDEIVEQGNLDQARTADPTSPTAPAATATAEDAVEAARSRLRRARDQIDQIREERRGAENTAVSALDDAGDLGLENRKWYQNALRTLADIAEFVAFAFAVLAVAVIVVVLLTNPAGWAALGAALAAAGPLFAIATGASAVALGFKAGSLATGDEVTTWRALGGEALFLAATFGAGQKLKALQLHRFRAVTVQFRQVTTEIRPVLNLVKGTDTLVINQVRTTVRLTQVTIVQRTITPLHLNVVLDAGVAGNRDIPKYLDENPPLARTLRGTAPVAVGVAPAGGRTVDLIHTPMPSPVGAR